MKTCIIFIVILTGLSGCAMLKTSFHTDDQRKKLEHANTLLRDDKTSAAKTTLSEIAKQPPVSDVTDEALFRLALLELNSDSQKISTVKAEKDLADLLNMSGPSAWHDHANALQRLINAYGNILREKTELEKTVKSLKSSNAYLARENTDLRQDMEKLKKLDLELEMKKKR